MRRLFLKQRRDWAIDRIIANGKRLYVAYAAREALLDAYTQPDAEQESAGLDVEIARLERAVERDREFIRKTAPEA